ncbi:hypothetical protein CYMTET_42876 [Cymbomonas tetramitiformis]|uniref:Tyr recombinase domain-containing protein n=1 Tax=Cymbomonas tetramitiformis TaxID=36881 RepID=A0AAE0C3D9_9CHLO|nr:hypothetical protein CYMTET_42876 [Cymbomonas tetramitiformis]
MTAAGGYFIHLEKTQFIASRTFIWLGIGVDLAEGEFFIPERQWTKFLKLVADLKASPAITTRDLERVAGKLVSMSVAAPGILIACRKLYSFLGQRDNFSRFGLYLNAKQVATFKAFLKQLDLFPLVTTSKFRIQAHCSILVEANEPLDTVSASINAGNFHTTLVRHTDLKNLSSTDQSFLIADILFDIPLCKVPQRWDLILDRNFWDCPRVLSSNLGKTVCKDLAKQLYTFVSHNNLDLKIVSFKRAPDGSVIIPDEESHYSLLPKFSPLLSQEFGKAVTFQDWIQLFLILRTKALILMDLYALKRPTELGATRVEGIIRFPDNSGFLFNYQWGKTLRAGDAHVFGIRRLQDKPKCPISALEDYLKVMKLLKPTLSEGFLFRPVRSGIVENRPLTRKQMNSDLKFWLEKAGLFRGETFFSIRTAGAIQLFLEGSDLKSVMGQAYWKTERIARHYMKIWQVLGMSSGSVKNFSQKDYLELNAAQSFVRVFV